MDTHAHVRRSSPVASGESDDERLAGVDGINGAAGHELEDPRLRELLRQRIAGEITSAEYRELGMTHLLEVDAEGGPARSVGDHTATAEPGR